MQEPEKTLARSCSLACKLIFHKSYSQEIQADLGDINWRTQEPWASWFLVCRSAL